MIDLSRISSVGEALDDATIMYKSATALIEIDRNREKERISYRDLRADAQRVTALLCESAPVGFPATREQEEAPFRVAILMSNQAKWLVTATGAFWAGATIVPLDYKLTAPEQVALLRHCRPAVLVTEYSTWRKLDLSDFNNLRVLVTEAPEGESLSGPAGIAVERWEQTAQRAFASVARRRSDIASIVYSSGTGGTPKGCQLTHGNYLAQAEVLASMYPMEEGERYFSILPTNHAIDFMCGFIVPFIMGANVVHQRTLRPQYIVDTMKRYEITHMALVPLILKALKERIQEKLDELPSWQRSMVDGLTRVNELATKREPRHELSRRLLKPIHDGFGGHLKLMFCGGAFVDRDAAEFFYRLGLPVVIGYGLTEAGTVLTVNDLKPFRGDTVGKPVRGTEVQLRNSNPEGVGEVWVRGPTVMAGYLHEPELTADAIQDGWLKTGDLGTLDASGHLKLCGRSKNMIVTEGGKNVYPEDIEAAFDGVKNVEEICAYASSYIWPTGKMTGESLVLVVRPKDGGRVDDASSTVGLGLTDAVIAELRARNRRLTDYKRVAGIIAWSREFPRTASMKVKRDPLKAELAAHEKVAIWKELPQ